MILLRNILGYAIFGGTTLFFIVILVYEIIRIKIENKAEKDWYDKQKI